MFFGFKEAQPKFPPTFKVERHEKGFKYKVRAPPSPTQPRACLLLRHGAAAASRRTRPGLWSLTVARAQDQRSPAWCDRILWKSMPRTCAPAPCSRPPRLPR